MKRRIYIFIYLIMLAISGFSQEKERNPEKETFVDFSFITTNEDKLNLSDIPTNYILLYFYNPECDDCTEVKKKLSKNDKLNFMIENNKITILAILPDVKKEYWLQNAEFIPKNWINGWCENDKLIIKAYLKKVPTFFLLDNQRRILDCSDEKIFKAIIKDIDDK